MSAASDLEKAREIYLFLMQGEECKAHAKSWNCGICKRKIAAALASIREERDAEVEGLKEALEQVKAALGDRLLGRGPLSKEYAQSVFRQINEALALAPPAQEGK